MLTLTHRRELDKLVADRVMGWTETADGPFVLDSGHPGGPRNACGFHGCAPDGRVTWIPEYSKDMNAAWTVVDKLKLCVWPETEGPHVGQWGAGTDHVMEWGNWEFGETAAIAICRAALKLAELAKT